jgi:hypothetical protein
MPNRGRCAPVCLCGALHTATVATIARSAWQLVSGRVPSDDSERWVVVAHELAITCRLNISGVAIDDETRKANPHPSSTDRKSWPGGAARQDIDIRGIAMRRDGTPHLISPCAWRLRGQDEKRSFVPTSRRQAGHGDEGGAKAEEKQCQKQTVCPWRQPRLEEYRRVEPPSTRGFARQAYSGMPEASQDEKATVANPIALPSTASADSVEGRAPPLKILPRDGSRACVRGDG